MRIGLMIDRWDPRRGGAERALDQLALHLEFRSDEVLRFGVSCTGHTAGTFHAVRAGGLSRGTRQKRLSRSMVAAAQGHRCDRTLAVRHVEQVDVLWLHGGSHAASVEASARAKGQTGPVSLRGRHRLYDELERTALEGGARRVVCPSELVREELIARYPSCAERLTVIEPGVDRSIFHPGVCEPGSLHETYGLSKDRPLIVFPAANPNLKGWRTLRTALEGIGPHHLLVAGPKRRPQGLHGTFVRHAHPDQLASGADLVVVPTFRDTFGLALLEAMASGTPVVTTRAAGIAPRVERGGGSLIDDPTDVEALRAAIEAELDNRRAPEEVVQATEGLDLEDSLERVRRVLHE